MPNPPIRYVDLSEHHFSVGDLVTVAGDSTVYKITSDNSYELFYHLDQYGQPKLRQKDRVDRPYYRKFERRKRR